MSLTTATKLWPVFKASADMQAFMKRARTSFPDTDTVVLRHVFYAFQVAIAAPADQPKPAKRARVLLHNSTPPPAAARPAPARKPATKGKRPPARAAAARRRG